MASKNNISVQGKTLEQLAKELGGKVVSGKSGPRVEYQATGSKGGAKYKATRYISQADIDAGQAPNLSAPVASDVYKEDYGTDNYRGPNKEIDGNIGQPPIINQSTSAGASSDGSKKPEKQTQSLQIIDYTKDPNESIDEYNARIDAARKITDVEQEPGDAPVDQYTPAATPSIQNTAPVSSKSVSTPSYTGNSIVDFLNQSGQASDFTSRAALATKMGIQGYSGSAEQNTQLLNSLRSGSTVPITSTTITPPATVTSTGTPATSSPSDLLASYGYSLSPDAAKAFQVAPAKSFTEVYNGLYKSLGLNDVKKEIDDTLKKVNSLDQELADKVSDINENPWLTEGVRRSQIQRLEERYELKRAPFASNLTLFQDLYNNGREEARYVATNTLSEYNKEREFQMDQINLWVDTAEKLAKASNQSVSEKYGSGIIGEYNFAVSQGYKGSFSQYQNEDANRKAKVTGGGTSGSSKTSTSKTSAKGKLSNKQFVELSLQKAGITYDSARSKVPSGMVGVVDNSTGQIGFIEPTEYSTSLYTYL